MKNLSQVLICQFLCDKEHDVYWRYVTRDTTENIFIVPMRLLIV
jgi:hypothetical protein